MHNESVTNAQELRKSKDKVIFFNEFAVVYNTPMDIDPERGYFAIYVTYEHTQNDNPEYEQEYYISGDNDMIFKMFMESCNGIEDIEKHLD